MEIKTNNHERQFAYRYEVPPAVLADEFAYQNPEDSIDGFFNYRGHWYHLDEFVNCGEDLQELGWHGIATDSYFSGVVISVSSDGETYRVGTVFS